MPEFAKAPLVVNGLNLYHVKVWFNSGTVARWLRYGADIETALQSAKEDASKESGGGVRSIAICGQQDETGVFCF
jgi:hypothetical protein